MNDQTSQINSPISPEICAKTEQTNTIKAWSISSADTIGSPQSVLWNALPHFPWSGSRLPHSRSSFQWSWWSPHHHTITHLSGHYSTIHTHPHTHTLLCTLKVPTIVIFAHNDRWRCLVEPFRHCKRCRFQRGPHKGNFPSITTKWKLRRSFACCMKMINPFKTSTGSKDFDRTGLTFITVMKFMCRFGLQESSRLPLRDRVIKSKVCVLSKFSRLHDWLHDTLTSLGMINTLKNLQEESQNKVEFSTIFCYQNSERCLPKSR